MLPDDSGSDAPEVESFRDFVEAVNPTLLRYRHVAQTLVPVAQKVIDGIHDRVLVLMPPRYFKSEVFSRLLPAYVLTKYSASHVGLTSYSSQLAWDLSEDARGYFREVGGTTSSSTDAKREWETTYGGKMWADGLGGSLTGKGFDLGIIDDPMKPQHARSPAYTREFRKWYPDTFYNRAEPGAAIIVVMQRLSSDDPIDFLYRREVGRGTDKDPQGWHVVCLDEIHSDEPLADYDGPKGLPRTCTLEEDNRALGEILAPERFDREEVEKQQSAARSKDAQRQQRAKESEGALWSQDEIDRGRVSGHPELRRIVVAVDPAVTSSESSDETGIIVAGVGYDDHAYILEDRSGTYTPSQWARKTVGAYKQHEADKVIGEVNNGGDLVESNLRGEDKTVSYDDVRATRGKTLRAEPVQNLYEGQNKVHHVGAFDQLEHQMTTWKGGSTDDSPDRLDALVWALTDLVLDKEQRSGGGMSIPL